MWPLLLAAALAAEPAAPTDFQPLRGGDPVLVVTTPGFARGSYLPLVNALERRGHDVWTLEFPCASQDVDALVRTVAGAVEAMPPETVLVAHGVGATLALLAAPHAQPERYVLLAPVLGVVPVEATRWLAAQPVPAAVDLGRPMTWKEQDLGTVLLGPRPHPLGCAPGPFLEELQGWVEGGVPLDPKAITASVFLAVSLGDDLATVEGTLELARLLAGPRRVVRLGLGAVQGQDFEHLEMLRHPAPVRVAVREVRRPRTRRYETP